MVPTPATELSFGPVKITPRQAHWFRLQRSGLVEPFATAEETASRLIGVQAQLATAAAISFWNRTADCTAASLEADRLERRCLVRLWGQRNTLHIYNSEDWPFLHTVFEERQSVVERKLGEAGLLGEFRRVVRRTEKRLAGGAVVAHRDIESKKLEEGQDRWVVSYAVLMKLVREGLVCHGPAQGSVPGFVHRAHWLPKLRWSPPDIDEAGGQLAERYLAAYGPAEVSDLAFWYGTTLTRARRWIEAAGDRCRPLSVGDRSAWFRASDAEDLCSGTPPPSRWPIRLLYRFDPLLLATKDKSWLIDEEHYKKVWRPGGHVEAVLLVRGRIGGTWRYDRKAKGLHVRLRPFSVLSRVVARAAEGQAAAIGDFLSLPLTRFEVSDPDG